MNKIEYDQKLAAYSQTECTICLNAYQHKEKVTELACKHLFHNECLTDVFVRCPHCCSAIEGRVTVYSMDEISADVERFLKKLAEVYPLLAFKKSEDKESFVKFVCARINEDNHSTRVMRSNNSLQLVRRATRILSYSTETDSKQICEYINQDATLILPEIETFVNSIPVTPEERVVSYPKMAFSVINGLKEFGVINETFKNYLEKLLERIQRDPKFCALMTQRCQQFEQVAKAHYLSLGFLARGKYLRSFEGFETQFEMVKKFPNAQRDLKINDVLTKILVIAFIVFIAKMIAEEPNILL